MKAGRGSGIWGRTLGGKARERHHARPVFAKPIGCSWISNRCREWENRGNGEGALALSRAEGRMLAAAVLQLFVLGVGQNAHVAQEAQLANAGEQKEEVSCLGSPDPDLPPKSVPRALVLPSGSPGQFAGCAQRLCSPAGADSRRSARSQVRSVWPSGEEMLSGDDNAVKSSSFAGKQPCPLSAGVTSSPRHAFSSFLLTTSIFSAASGDCQSGIEQAAKPAGRWEHGKSHRQAGASEPLIAKLRALQRVFLVTEGRSSSAELSQRA